MSESIFDRRLQAMSEARAAQIAHATGGLNKQWKSPTQRGIEWTDYTWNPIGGCKHACRWQMPDGSVALCYAETVAERLATSAYPHGFAHHYWRPEALQAPLKLRTPAKIFLDSMSDLMGKWIPDEQVEAVLDICRQAHWHTFQLLTKNAPRLLQFRFPPNVWVGVSAPPSWMLGKQLTADQQRRMVERQCEVLAQVNVPVRWMSIEPLSFDIAPLLKGAPLEWAVIGAATNGKRTYQPRAEWIQSLLELFDQQGVKVFFKGNLEWQPWREEFPTSPVQATPQELPLDIRPNPTSYLEPPVKPKRSKRSAAQALGKRAVPSVSAASVTSAAQAAPIQAPAHDAQESVTASTASADAIKAELERCEKMIGVLSNVLKCAEIAPSKVNIEATQADLAALEQRRAGLQAQLKASAQKNVTASAPAKRRRHADDDEAADDDADDADDDDDDDDDDADVPIDWHGIARQRKFELYALLSEARRLAESGDLDGVRSVHERAQGVLSVMRSIPAHIPSCLKSAEKLCAEIAQLAEPSAVQANGAHESVTPIALAEPSAAQANGAHESVTSAALAEPSAVQANGAHESVTSAALAEPSAAQANGAHESVTSAALAEPSAVQANGAQVIHADIVRRWYGSDVTATLRTIAADRLRGDVIVMALDAPIATYRNGALAPELVTLARRCTVPSHTLRVTTPSATRTTVVYLVEMEHKQRLISMPISDAAERLCKSGVRVIEAMPYESYERYLNAAQRKRDAAKRGTAQRAKTRVNIAPAQASAVQESVTASASSGKRAEPAHYTLTCAVCGHQFEAKRSHAQTCSAKCRKRLSRANGAE